jgi:hypothetical protein
VPVDGAGGALPAELAALTASARAGFDAAGPGRWTDAAAAVDAMGKAWKRTGGSGVPELLADQLTGALAALGKAVDARDPTRAGQAALRVEQAVLDLHLRHRAPAAVDLERLDLWARQLQVDAAGGDLGAVAGDAATLRVLWDRAGHAAAPAAAGRVTAALAALDTATAGKDLRAAADALPALRDALAAASPRTGGAARGRGHRGGGARPGPGRPWPGWPGRRRGGCARGARAPR